jgi:tetratricopeptide (TPR) repeat protein
MRVAAGVILSLLLAWPALASSGAAADSSLAQARRLLMTGRYEEARRSFAAAARDSVPAAIGEARSWDATGARDSAVTILRRAAVAHPRSADLRAELARLEFESGRLEDTRRDVDAALELEDRHPAARFVAAELHRVAGRLEQANDGYRWFIRLYNQEQDRIQDPEVLRCIGLAAAQYARWNRNSGQFHFLVNTLYPDILKLDPSYWPAHLEAALLFVEKYNLKDAQAELDSAIMINPAAAEVHAARGLIALKTFDLDSARTAVDRALAINPRLVVAHQLAADIQMVAAGPRAALDVLEQVRSLDPVDEETLGRLAAVYGAIDGTRADSAGTRMGTVIAEVAARNEHCGTFFATLGSSLTLLSRFPHAVRYLEEARRRMPQLVTVPGDLGLAYMQSADEARARTLLQEAFGADPFNMRVKNTLEVLKLLDGYATLETEHFRIRYDRDRDSLLARYAGRYMEEQVFGPVVKTFGFAPRQRTLIEIFSRARGTSGHSWFSIRMSGLPFIGPVAASTGSMMGMTSPSEGTSRFNWARVLKHEFVHVVNLQQTDFNIARWYTEGLAVRTEGPGRPAAWDAALARRVATHTLYDLSTIYRGFLRPMQRDDWLLAYYQSELYTQYLVDRYGPDALNRLIAAYGNRLETPAALEHCFGVDPQAFESGYRAYVTKMAAASAVHAPPAPEQSLDTYTLERALERSPHDAELHARLALAYWRIQLRSRAQEHATAALEIDPRHQRAAFVLASVHAREGRAPQALEVLRNAFDPQAPDAEMLDLFATLAIQAGDDAEAERLLRLGQERFPEVATWRRGLAKLYRKVGQKEKLRATLSELAEADPDDLDARQELAQLALDRADFPSAVGWAEEALHVDVANASAHAVLGRGLMGCHRPAPAIDEFETAVGLEPTRLEWRWALAEACVAAKKPERARRALDELLARDRQYPGARALRDRLAGSRE